MPSDEDLYQRRVNKRKQEQLERQMKREKMPFSRGPQRGLEQEDNPPNLMVHPMKGPEGPPPRNPFHERVQMEEKAFLKKGSERGPGTYTARETGARGLAIRHFEHATRMAQDQAKRIRRRAII